MFKKNIKKVFMTSMCVALSLLMSGCIIADKVETAKERKDDSTTDTKHEYTKGTLTESVYVNESANLKFELPDGYKFDDPSDVVTSEMIAKGSGFASVNIMAEKIGTSYTMEDCVKQLEGELEKTYSSLTGGSISIISTDKKEKLCNNEYRLIEADAKNNGIDIDIKMYIRLIDDHIYSICVSYQDDSKVEYDKIIEKFSELSDSDDLDKYRDESEDFKEKLEEKKNIEAQDPTVSRSNTIGTSYMKGSVIGNTYKNLSTDINLEFELPKGYEFCKGAAYEMMAKNPKNGSFVVVSNEYVGKTYSMDEYVQASIDAVKNEDYKIISSDTIEKLGTNEWRVMVVEFAIQDVTYVQKAYIRICNDKAVIVAFVSQKGKESTMDILKKAFS